MRSKWVTTTPGAVGPGPAEHRDQPSGYIALVKSTLNLPSDPSSPAAARSFIRSTLAGWQVAHLAETGALLVSELVTNAVRYDGPAFSVVASTDPRCVRIAVEDGSAPGGQVQVRHVDDTCESGRGMLLVEGLSDRWGVDPLAGHGGKAVWAELDR